MTRRSDYSSSRRLRRTSDQVNSSMVGAHIPRKASSRPRHMNAEQVDFSSSRKARRAARGQVDTLIPPTTTRESAQQWQRRASRREYVQAIQRKRRIRRILFIAGFVVLAIVLAVAVGVGVFFASMSGRLSLSDSNASEALVATSEDQSAFYILFCAELGATQGATNEEGYDAYILAHANEESGSLDLIWLPANLSLSYGSGESGRLRDAAVSSDADLIEAVSEFAGVDIAYFVTSEVDNIADIVDTLGGISIELEEEVDDPNAGTVYLPIGQHTLTSEEIPTVLRASNYSDSNTQAQVQCEILANILEKLAASDSGLSDATLLDSLSDTFSTNASSEQILELASIFSGFSAESANIASVPGSEVEQNDMTLFSADSDEWTTLIESIDANTATSEDEQSASTVDPSSFTITIRNGAGITGAAAQMSEQLTADGFVVSEIGNTDSAVYTETLVIYSDENYEAAAETVVAALDSGRVVNGGDYYSFDTDILVVLGSDWKPLT